MEKKKNIIHITGKDIYRVERETSGFIKAFRERHDTNSIDTYSLDAIDDWRNIIQNVQTIGLFAEKRLFIFRGSLKKEPSKSGEPSKSARKSEESEKILQKICEEITDDTFIIFSGVIFDEKSSLKKWLEAHADMRAFDTPWSSEVWQSRHPLLAKNDIDMMIMKCRNSISPKGENEASILASLHEALEKLSLIRESRPLTKSDFENSLFLDTLGNVFGLSDAILRVDVPSALKSFRTITETTNIHAFLAGFIGLIRQSVYTKYYKHLGKTQKEVSTYIQISPFVLQKAYESRISYPDLYQFYEKILSINIAYRSGKGRKDPELGRIFDIELAIMGLKK